MKKLLFVLMLMCSSLLAFGYSQPTLDYAEYIGIDDIGGYYSTSTNVEEALQAIGDGTTLDDRYVNESGDTMEGDLNLDDNNLSTTGSMKNNADNSKHYFGASDDYSVEWNGLDAVHTITAGDFVFTGGNVGIGKTDPSDELEVYSSTTPVIATTWGTASSYGGLLFKENATTKAAFLSIGSDFSTSSRRGNLEFQQWGDTGDIVFWTDVGEAGEGIKFIIKNNGNVGIGDSSPDAKLTINNNGGTDYSPVTSAFDMGLGIAANTSDISGMDFKNFHASGQVRLMARNNSDDYIVLNIPGSSATGSWLGVDKDKAAYVWSTGSNRDLAIGTLDAGAIVLGTNNVKKIAIGTNGHVEFRSGTGYLAFNYDTGSEVSSNNSVHGWTFNNNGDSIANMFIVADGATDAGRFDFYTQPTGGSSTLRMRLDSSGNLRMLGDNQKVSWGASDDASIYFDGSDLNIFGEATGDINFFSDTDVGDAVDGKKFIIHRKAAEGDSYIEMYINDLFGGTINANLASLYLTSSYGLINRAGSGNDIIFGDYGGNDIEFGSTYMFNSPKAPTIYLYGDSDGSGTIKYITHQVQTDGFYKIDREDTNINGIEINMPIKPDSLADASASNGTIYYSTTQSKLVFKDSGGTVRNLY